MLKGLLAVVLGGIVIFVWVFIAKVMIGFHDPVIHGAANEAAVMATLKAELGGSGAFEVPRYPNASGADADALREAKDAWAKKRQEGPVAFLFVRQEGITTGSADTMLKGLGLCVGSCLLAVLLLFVVRDSLPGVFQRIVFITLIGVLTTLPHWSNLIWYQYPLDYTLLMALDMVIGWFLASIVIAKLVKPSTHVV